MNKLQWLGVHNEHLVDAGQGHRLHEAIAGPFSAMQQAAAEQGIDCQIVSGFRNFDRQLSIWNRKWQGELPLYTPEGQPLDTGRLTELEKLHAILTFSALPGGSRHHWGTDIDVYDERAVTAWQGKFSLINAEYSNEGPCAALANWLDSHALAFGFSRPYAHYNGGVAQELWHLSHRQTAKTFEAALDSEVLRTHIEQSAIAGKQTILANLDMIFDRYILNRGA